MLRFMSAIFERGGSMRRIGAVAGLAALVALSPPAQAQTKTVTLGAALQLTGATANLGRYFRDGYQIAIERINEAGGLDVAGTRYRLALKLLDNQSDINLGVREYVQLVTRDKVDFLLGPYSSNDTLDASSVAEKYHVVMVEGGGASREIFSRGYSYIFGTSPPADDYFASTIEMMTKLEPRPKTLALLVADDSFDVAVAEGARRHAAEGGFEIVLDKQYSEHNSDFSALLALVKSKKPDAILWGGHETEALNFLREAKSLDVNPNDLAALTVGVPSADFRAALGKDADYVFGMTPWLASPLLRDKWFGDAQQFAVLFQRASATSPTTMSPRPSRRSRPWRTASRRPARSIWRRCATPSPRAISKACSRRSTSPPTGRSICRRSWCRFRPASSCRSTPITFSTSRFTPCPPGASEAKVTAGAGRAMLFLQLLVNGVLLGGLYGLMALGMALVWGVLNIVNLAHGALIMLGGYCVYYLFTGLGIDPFAALPIAMAMMFVVGYVLQRFVLNLIIRSALLNTLLITFGLEIVLTYLAQLAFSADVRTINPSYAGANVSVWGVTVPLVRFGAFLVAILLAAALWVLLERTRLGRAIRATAQNLVAARLYGVDPAQLYAVTFGLGAALAGAAGGLYGLVSQVTPYIGATLTAKSFVITIMGGLDNPFGIILGGLVIGIAEALAAIYIGPTFTDAISFGLLVLILVARPARSLRGA